MVMRLFPSRWLPFWLRNDHPIVRRHLRKPLLGGLNQMIFGSTFGLFLLFGGLSLPMMYLLFSLIVLVQLASGTAGKIYDERERHTWDLIRAAPFTRREVLLSTWAAGIWQIDRTWLMPFYRLLQAIVVVGLLVFGLWLGDIPGHLYLPLLVSGTLLIVLQPLVDMYFGGMIGLLMANLVQGRAIAQAAAACVTLVYWVSWIALSFVVVFSDLTQLTIAQVFLVVSFPLLLPMILGYVAFRVAVAATR
jgi:hypothetical protein